MKFYLFNQSQVGPVKTSGPEQFYQPCRVEVSCFIEHCACVISDCLCEVTFTDARRPDDDHILIFLDEVEGKEPFQIIFVQILD